jgi:hypothetical protein
VPGKYGISLKVTIFSNLLPPLVSQPSSSQAQPPSAQKITLLPGEGSKSKANHHSDNQTFTKSIPAKNISLQSPLPSPPIQHPHSTSHSLEPTQTSNHKHFSLNATTDKQASTSEKQHADTHLTPQITSMGTCSMTAPNSSLYPGSISIDLQPFNIGPSLVTNKKAQGKKPLTRISKTCPTPTELPNNSNISHSPTKNTSSTPHYPHTDINPQPKPLSPSIENQETPNYPTKNPKTHLKKKRHRISEPYISLKKGSVVPSCDHRQSDDMDFSDHIEPPTPHPQTNPSFSPPHFFKAARIRKPAAPQAHLSQKSGNIELFPNPP